MGVASTGGTTPTTVTQMARDAIVFLEALKLSQVDLLGFSLGGFVAQEIALLRPYLVRRLILAGTGPQGGPVMHGWRKDIADAARSDQVGGENLLYIMFKQTPSSQAKGMEYLGRFMERKDRDASITLQTRDAQYDAVVDWGVPDHNKLARLTAIAQPTFVANGDDDLMCPPRLTHLMGGLSRMPKSRSIPTRRMGFLWQHHEEFGADVNAFLSHEIRERIPQMTSAAEIETTPFSGKRIVVHNGARLR